MGRCIAVNWGLHPSPKMIRRVSYAAAAANSMGENWTRLYNNSVQWRRKLEGGTILRPKPSAIRIRMRMV